jgi:hypothetical protein
MGYQFDQWPCVSAFVVSLEGHNGASSPIECPIRMLRVANEIAFILLAMRRLPVVKCTSKNNNACI